VRKIVVTVIMLASIAVVAFAAQHEDNAQAVLPAKISKEDMTGSIFSREDMVEMERYGTNTLDVMTLMSSDKKFASGIYKAGKHQIVLTEEEPYGVDEFLYMVEGTMTLTSIDGSVQEIGPGEAVTIPKEWAGVVDTEGYLQRWVSNAEDGSGLE